MVIFRGALLALTVLITFAPCQPADAGLYRVDFSRIGIAGGAVASGAYEAADFVCVDVVNPSYIALSPWNVNAPDYIPNLEPSSAELSWALYE